MLSFEGGLCSKSNWDFPGLATKVPSYYYSYGGRDPGRLHLTLTAELVSIVSLVLFLNAYKMYPSVG